MKKSLLLILLLIAVAAGTSAKTKGVKIFHANYHQTLDPDPRNAGNWFIGPIEELPSPYIIYLYKSHIRVNNVTYFIDKSTVVTRDYTEEENVGYAKSTSYSATDLTGRTIFVSIEYANRENPYLYGFSIFDRANQGHFYLAVLQK